MGIKVGALIKEARTAAKLSQTKLAELVGVSASDISKAEKGEKELSQAVLKKIATATGVTQKSLIDAAKEEAGSDSGLKKVGDLLSDVLGEKKTAKKTATKKAEPAKKTAAKKAEPAKKTTATKTAAKKTTGTKMELTAAEKKLIELYRAADSDTKKNAVNVLKGEGGTGAGIVGEILSGLLK